MIDLLNKIHEALQQKESLFTAAGLPPIAFTDKFRGQPLNPLLFTYTTPALFIEAKTAWQKSGKAYNGQMLLNFHVVTDAELGYSSENPAYEEKFSSEKYYTILRSVLDDLNTDQSGKLTRIEEKSADTGQMNYQILSYECFYADPMLVNYHWTGNADENEERGLMIERRLKNAGT